MTPMFKQYHEVKARHRDAILLFRMGDFYEMFYEDAILASRILGLALTSRSKEPDAPPMAGFPHHSAETHIEKLIRAGHKVAICEQLEDPTVAKGIVDRGVIRVVTPGTLTEEKMLSAGKENFLAAVRPRVRGARGAAGIAWVELSTGSFEVAEVSVDEARDELARIAPAECLFAESVGDDDELLRFATDELGGMVTRVPDWTFESRSATNLLLEHFSVTTLAGFGVDHLEGAVAAAGAILRYLGETQKTSLSHIRGLRVHRPADYLLMDRGTIRALELTETMRTGEERGSLIGVLDRTRTPMGKRLLRRWTLSPLVDVEGIRRRLDAVAELVGKRQVVEDLAGLLADCNDIERLTGRLATGRAHPRDLLSLSESLAILPDVSGLLATLEAGLFRGMTPVDILEDVRRRMVDAIDPDAPMLLKEGGLIRDGHTARLDELRSLIRDGTAWIANYQAEEIRRTRIPTLKVGFNNVFGYYIEITHVHGERVPPEYIRKQTLKNAERYITPELKEYERKVLTAQEESRQLEYDLFVALREELAKEVGRLKKAAETLAELDVLGGLASSAIAHRYARPEIVEEPVLFITEGRHPVLEQLLTDTRFVPNDAAMSEDEGRVLLITGPNMAGKSTYIRQVALIVILAQMGSFVPAREARIGIVDRIFTRVGASDELARGQSTFMVEMIEAANILNNATRRSLIILDEVGRGTSTFDGISLAWAITEHIHDRVDARTLFATHYHELTELADHLEKVENYNVAVKEWGHEVVFLRRIVPGATDKSYGIHVARLAGVPPEVIERARALLVNLEENVLSIRERPDRRGPKPRLAQLSLFRSPAEARLLEEMRRIDPEVLTPIEALQKLTELRRQLTEG
ncbi:MAG: DNA mismatch repair protein MutS [Planctomycetota bacterium]